MLLQQRCLKSIGGSTPLSPCPSRSPCSRLRLPAGPSWTECGFPDQQGLLSCCFTVRQVDRNQLARLASTIRISVDCHVIWGWAHHKMGYPTISASEGKSPQGRGGRMECWLSGTESLTSAEMRNVLAVRFCCPWCVFPLSSEATSALFFKQVKRLQTLNLIGNLLISLVEVYLYKSVLGSYCWLSVQLSSCKGGQNNWRSGLHICTVS